MKRGLQFKYLSQLVSMAFKIWQTQVLLSAKRVYEASRCDESYVVSYVYIIISCPSQGCLRCGY